MSHLAFQTILSLGGSDGPQSPKRQPVLRTQQCQVSLSIRHRYTRYHAMYWPCNLPADRWQDCKDSHSVVAGAVVLNAETRLAPVLGFVQCDALVFLGQLQSGYRAIAWFNKQCW